MKLSMLRPLEGWRAFAGEVGVVVLGVLPMTVLSVTADAVARIGGAR